MSSTLSFDAQDLPDVEYAGRRCRGSGGIGIRGPRCSGRTCRWSSRWSSTPSSWSPTGCRSSPASPGHTLAVQPAGTAGLDDADQPGAARRRRPGRSRLPGPDLHAAGFAAVAGALPVSAVAAAVGDPGAARVPGGHGDRDHHARPAGPGSVPRLVPRHRADGRLGRRRRGDRLPPRSGSTPTTCPAAPPGCSGSWCWWLCSTRSRSPSAAGSSRPSCGRRPPSCWAAGRMPCSTPP